MPISTEMIDVAKTAKRCHDWGVSPAGTGENQIAVASTKGNARFAKSFHILIGGVGSLPGAVTATEPLMTGVPPRLIHAAAHPPEHARATRPTVPARRPPRYRGGI